MSLSAPFSAMGPSFVITAATSPPTPIQLPATTPGPNNFRVVNTDAATHAWLAWGDTAAEATANAVIPTTGNPKNKIMIFLDAQWDYVCLPPNCWVTAITGAASAVLAITPGDGGV